MRQPNTIHRKINPDVIKEINHVAVDMRLPTGFKSWAQLAKNVANQDDLNLRNDNILIRCNKQYQSIPVEEYTESHMTNEAFECDVLTLKIRAFDELKDILPDYESLLNMKRDIRMLKYHAHQDPNQETGMEKLIEKLLKLY